MKKILLALLCAPLSITGIYAQTPLTLTNAGYTSTFAGTTDTLLGTATTPVYPSFTPTVNATWDMTGAVSNTVVSYGYNVNALTTPFASAQFADSTVTNFSTYSYIDNEERAFTAAGYVAYGRHINRQAIHLTGGTFGPTDSLIFNLQNMVYYSAPWTLISFPATYHTTWTSTFSDSFNFALDVAIASYSNTPGTIKESVTEIDSVVGWGQMRVKKLDGTAGGYMHVLQVRKRLVRIDSFFINGAPAAGPILTGLGLSQGARTTAYSEAFYRPDDARPLASVTFTDSTFSTPNGASTLAQKFNSDLTAGVNTIADGKTINIYPNPITNNTISIDMPDAQNGNWTYELINIAGERAASGSLPISNNQTYTQITLPDSITPGIYYLSLKNNVREIAVRPLDIVK